jgi:hypothetical protein
MPINPTTTPEEFDRRFKAVWDHIQHLDPSICGKSAGPEPPSPPALSKQVEQVERQADAMIDLCSEVLATLHVNLYRGTLICNGQVAHEQFAAWLIAWDERLASIKALTESKETKLTADKAQCPKDEDDSMAWPPFHND